ncbi:MAG: serine hydrolase [Mariniphaga sp.]|nr:serine hydrolase [Mariniphaga sp.]MDD4225276.1 serine hydrolase [Mariniphaga sp.]MDD4424766.1 serine hydrolase [Mariniphaga sp.]
MKRTCYFLTIFFLLVYGCERPSEKMIVFPQEDWQVASPESQGIDKKRLDTAMSYLDSVCGDLGTSRSMVIKNGYIIWQGDDIKSRHLVWSCTKSFMSTCLGLLWDDGLCSPDTKAQIHFDKLKVHYPDVTIEHLATFTSGYNHEKEDVFEPVQPDYAPGEAFHYSRQSDVLARVLTMAGKESLGSLFERRVASVIGITPEQMEWKDKGQVNGITLNGGAGMPESGVYITAEAMARFGWLYCCNGNWNGQQVISTKYIHYATSPRVSTVIPPYDTKAWYAGLLTGNYGLNWWVNGEKPDGTQMWPHAPEGTFAAQGNKNNICLIAPAWNMVIVRIGGDEIIDTDLYDGVFKRLTPQ